MTGRFLNADTTSVLTASPMALTDKNLYAYCDNNPVMRVDVGGQFWDIVVDVASLFVSIVDVVCNPTKVESWVSVGADLVCTVVPFATGGGALVKVVTKADDVIDACKVVDTTDDVVDASSSLYKVGDEWFHPATVGTPNEVGKMGEELAGISSSGKVKIEVEGRNRIPDKMTPTELIEVKNVKYISNTQQLKDFAYYASLTGRSPILLVRPTTKVAKTVTDAGWDVKSLWSLW